MPSRSSLPTFSIGWFACSSRRRVKFSLPDLFSAMNSRAKSPDWISLRIFLHRCAGLGTDHAGSAGEVAVLGRVGDRVLHAADALLVEEVSDQLELVQALEVGELRAVASLGQRLEAGDDQLGGAAAENCLLAEEVGLGLVLEGRLDDASAGAADALGVCERDVAGVAGCVLLDGDESGDSSAFFKLRADQVARALRRDERDVDRRRRVRPVRKGSRSRGRREACCPARCRP